MACTCQRTCQSIKTKKSATVIQAISEELIKAGKDPKNAKYPWATAIGLEGTELPNNLKRYLYLLLVLMRQTDKTAELASLKKQVDTIDKALRLR